MVRERKIFFEMWFYEKPVQLVCTCHLTALYKMGLSNLLPCQTNKQLMRTLECCCWIFFAFVNCCSTRDRCVAGYFECFCTHLIRLVDILCWMVDSVELVILIWQTNRDQTNSDRFPKSNLNPKRSKINEAWKNKLIDCVGARNEHKTLLLRFN